MPLTSALVRGRAPGQRKSPWSEEGPLVRGRAPGQRKDYGSPESREANRRPTMAAAVAAGSIQSASPARELTLSAQQAAGQVHGDRVKREEEGTGEHSHFHRFLWVYSPPPPSQTRTTRGVLTASHGAMWLSWRF